MPIVSFSDPPTQQREGSTGGKNDKAWNWFLKQIFQDDGIRDDEHTTAVAAATFAIHSLEEAKLLNLQKMKEGAISSRTQTARRKEESMSKQLSYGRTSNKKSFGQDSSTAEGAFPVRIPSGVHSPRPIAPVAGYQKQKESPKQPNNVKTIAESWEKAKMEKIQKRFEKIKSKILFWEGEKKMQAKLHMNRKKSAMEHRRATGIQHYQIKIARIDMIAQGARAQLEDKKRKKESRAREKADKIRKTGRVPVKCFCFNC